MKYNSPDYSFWGLSSKGIQRETPITSLVYLIALVDTAESEIVDLKKAYFTLAWLFDVEEQVETAAELLSVQAEDLPLEFHPQTPVMVTSRWSPISALLERDWEPIVLSREDKPWACASGIWRPKTVENCKPYSECGTSEELFWSILKEVAQKAQAKDRLISLVAKPGWSYESNVDRPHNIDLAEAKKADRVIWQRTPRQ